MDVNNRFYLYKEKLSVFIFLLISLVVIAIFAILSLFVGAIVGTAIILYMVYRLFISSKTKQTRGLEKDNSAIILKEGDYEIMEKGRKT
jgi:hypothetical protein